MSIAGGSHRGSRHSIPNGDIVLSSLPPYSTQPWLNTGIVLHTALLARAGIRARVVRPLDPPFVVPERVVHASLVTFVFDPPMAERMEAMEQAYREAPGFFEGIVDELLKGTETVIGLSVYRNNVDVSLWIARQIKEKRPSALVILGGPEAVEEPTSLLLPWIDVVVGRDAECVMVQLVRACLDGRIAEAAGLPNVWLNPRLSGAMDDPTLRPAMTPPAWPTIDYTALMPLLVGDLEPTVPLLLNWGCPYHCVFCSNRGIYGRFTAGNVGRVLEEMDSAVTAWSDLHGGAAPGINLQLSDATTNALPAQFDELLQGVIGRLSHWPVRPHLRGQTLLDSRLTDERAQLMAQAGFAGTFFGLDAANDSLRGDIRKPGKTPQVIEAMATYRRAGLRGLNVGVLVGLPGETEANFTETERFVDRVLAFGETIESITVLPYVWFLSAQGVEFGKLNRGARRGLLWRSSLPGGDPSERARRFMRVFERIDGRATTCSPVPPYLALPAMLPDEDPQRLEAWMARHGRVFDQLTPNQEKRLHVATPARTAEWTRAHEALESLQFGETWKLEGAEWRGNDAATAELVVLFRRVSGEERVAVLVQRSQAGRRAFTKTRDFDVSYLRQWRGLPCIFDEQLVTSCARKLREAEAREPNAKPVTA